MAKSKLATWLEFKLPCGDWIELERSPRETTWKVYTMGTDFPLVLTEANALGLIEAIREASRNTPRGIRD